ncbi:endo-1,4-beta-xylanase [Scytonema tolypothrichoides VB-61278]|nr:endo-1,4-beta-xylanase [Scytonema tolypothrichoides VB-61278]
MRFFIRRRSFLLGLGTLASTVPLVCANRFKDNNQVKAQYNRKRNFSIVGNTSLRKRAAAKGLIYGAFPSFGYENLSINKQLQSAFIRECGLLVGGFYWSVTRPSINNFNFNDTDSFAQFASKHGMLFRGHPLVWHQVIPQWLISKFQDPKTTSKEIENVLTNHVSTIVKRYAGRIHSWDVVNEAIEPKHGRPDGLQDTPWLKFLGPDYIDLAFRTARDADPKALLVYNDALLDHDTPEHEARRIATLKLLKTLKSKGTPVQALGIQAHLFADKPLNSKKLRAFLRDVASLGLKILITELDVSDNQLPRDINVRDRIVASVYEDYLSIVLEEPAVIAVITWGFTDSDTWLSRFPRSDKAPLRPLPFDFNMKPKLAWNAIARAFDKAPKR